MTGPLRRRLLIAAMIVGPLVAGCGPTASGMLSPSTSPSVTGPPDGARRPIVIDADMDHSDIAAIAILLRDPAVDVRAITISGTGLVHCAGGLRVTRYLLDELREEQIPFACGREDGARTRARSRMTGAPSPMMRTGWRSPPGRSQGYPQTP